MEENKQQPEISEVTEVTSEEVIQEALKPRPVYGQAYDMPALTVLMVCGRGDTARRGKFDLCRE